MGTRAQTVKAFATLLESYESAAYERAAIEAFNDSACVKLALQMPGVNIAIITSIYKAAFGDGARYGAQEMSQLLDRTLAKLTCDRQH